MNPILVGMVMGSSSDWDTMQHASQILHDFGVAFEAKVVSAHRMPDEMFAYAQSAHARGLRVIIAGAGGAAHLPGMLAAKTTVPVLGVPVPSFAIGAAGAANAALFAVAMLAHGNPALQSALDAFRSQQTEAARAMTVPPAA